MLKLSRCDDTNTTFNIPSAIAPESIDRFALNPVGPGFLAGAKAAKKNTQMKEVIKISMQLVIILMWKCTCIISEKASSCYQTCIVLVLNIMVILNDF